MRMIKRTDDVMQLFLPASTSLPFPALIPDWNKKSFQFYYDQYIHYTIHVTGRYEVTGVNLVEVHLAWCDDIILLSWSISSVPGKNQRHEYGDNVTRLGTAIDDARGIKKAIKEWDILTKTIGMYKYRGTIP